MKLCIIYLFVVVLAFGAVPVPAESAVQAIVVENGIASFYVRTNIPGIEISGKSGEVKAHVRVHHDRNGLNVERIEARVPVMSLKTGMSLRDEHMRKRIFTTERGEVPELRFESGDVTCPGVSPGHEAKCTIAGTMVIRGIPHAFSLPMKVRQESNGTAFRATGDGVVKLSDYGIEQPSQLGVKAANEIVIHLDLSGKEVPQVALSSGGQ
jgi:polyisoprenoid-binding protein YceI